MWEAKVEATRLIAPIAKVGAVDIVDVDVEVEVGPVDVEVEVVEVVEVDDCVDVDVVLSEEGEADGCVVIVVAEDENNGVREIPKAPKNAGD